MNFFMLVNGKSSKSMEDCYLKYMVMK